MTSFKKGLVLVTPRADRQRQVDYPGSSGDHAWQRGDRQPDPGGEDLPESVNHSHCLQWMGCS
ncbi:hypothetical protein [Malonomonas rubra]|uniref:hypothetical protein n=1 Tax=Malonomonas rubra TaxID=57040 RepID=UPI0026F032E2|nr:hypothetical protein [Malonomonas rubra]